MSSVLDREYTFFNARKEELMREHPGEYVLISGDRIIGFFPTEREAHAAGLTAVGNIPMLIERLADEPPIVILSPILIESMT